ncbi:MAG: PadR family transcriptional regulator [Myxococcota bacterium]
MRRLPVHHLRRKLAKLTDAPLGPRGRFFGPGEIRLAVLALLQERPSHGYDLMVQLETRCGGAYQASAGAIYPTLQQLEDEGLVRSKPTGGKKVYTLSAAGRALVTSEREVVQAIWRRAETWSDWGILRDPDAAEIMGPALRLAKVALKTVVKSRGDGVVIQHVRNILERATNELELLQRGRRK